MNLKEDILARHVPFKLRRNDESEEKGWLKIRARETVLSRSKNMEKPYRRWWNNKMRGGFSIDSWLRIR